MPAYPGKANIYILESSLQTEREVDTCQTGSRHYDKETSIHNTYIIRPVTRETNMHRNKQKKHNEQQ